MSASARPCAVPGENHSDDRVTVYAGSVLGIPLCGYHAQGTRLSQSLAVVRDLCPREWNPRAVWCHCHGWIDHE